MIRLVKRMETDPPQDADWQGWLDAGSASTVDDDHAAGRKRYIAEGHGTPPA